MRSTLRAAIRERRATAGLAERSDILSMLLLARRPDGSALDDEKIIDELLTVLVAGHETTAASLAWTLDLLLHHPATLDRLATDLAAGGGEELLDAVIRESLRLRPAVPEIGRHLRVATAIARVDLPAGVVAVLSIHLLHRRPDLHPDPLAFRPERFLDRRIDAHAWLPFGGGTRRCLGAAFATLEMRVVLRTVLTSVPLRATARSLEPARRQVVTLVPRREVRALVER